MSLIPQHAIDDLLARTNLVSLAGEFVRLRGGGQAKIGPCPLCSPDPQSKSATRFKVWPHKFVCAVCCKGGNAIALVMARENLSFPAAVERLGGTREIDPKEAARIAAKAQAQREKQERIAALYREQERSRCFEIWRHAKQYGDDLIRAYHGKRDLLTPPDLRLRQLPRVPYYRDGKGSAVLHTGPAIIAPILSAEHKFSGLHFTWLDLDREKGKAKIVAPDGEEFPAKKVRGTKTGGYMLVQGDFASATTTIAAEGRETVQAFYTSMIRAGKSIEGTLFLAGIDLGNLAGRAMETVAHPFLKSRPPASGRCSTGGRSVRVPNDIPDLDAPAMPVPEQTELLIGLGDGDSDEFTTRQAMTRFARRHAKPSRRIRTPFAPPGEDYDSWRRA